MDVAITGSSGLVGTALMRALQSGGHRPIAVVRRPASGADEIRWEPASNEIDAESFTGIGAVVHLAGAGIADKRWTEERKKVILESRTQGTSLLASALAGLDRPPLTLISGSAIGYYGFGHDPVSESAPSGSGFLADLVVAWEASAQPAVDSDSIRVVFARTGIVQSKQGGALAKQLPLFKLGLGGRMGSGDQWVSWISIDDEIAALIWLLTDPVGKTIAGPVNLTAPEPVTNAAYTKALGAAVNRPTLIPIPGFGPKLIFGSELVDEILLNGQRVLPTVLTDGGYPFIHTNVEDALADIVGRQREVAQ